MQANPHPDFRLLFETLPGLHLVLKPDFTIMAASNSYLEATMIRREEVMGQSMFDVFPDNPADEYADGSANLRASLNYVLQHHRPHKMAIQKYDVRRPDGIFEERYWSPLNSPVLDDSGNLCCILHYAEDVTEKQKKQKEIDFLSLQIERAQDAIYTVDEHLNITNWNYGAEKLYGFTKEEVTGRSPRDILQTDVNEVEVHRIRNKVDHHDHDTGEIKRKTKDGRDIWVHYSISTVRIRGKITGYVVVSFDTTEQKQLRDRVNHLAGIVENSSEAIFSRGNDMRMISWNKGAETLFGFSKEEVIGKNARDIGFFNFSPEQISQVENTIMRKGTWQADMIFRRKQGSTFYGSITGNFSRNEDGVTSSFYFIVKDISLHKKLEDQLKKSKHILEQRVKERTAAIEASEKKYHYLFENNPLPMWVIDKETFRFLAVNETAIVHYGYSREQFLSMTAFDIRPEADKESFLRIQRKKDSYPGIHDAGIWNHVKKDGSLIQVKINAHYIKFGERPASLILINDVTETIEAEEKLQASEKRFRTLIEKAHDAMLLMDASFNVVYRSPAAESMVGWSNEEMVNRSGLQHIHPDDLEQVRATAKQLIDNPGVTYKTMFRNKHKNGQYIWIEGFTTNWLHDENVKSIVFNSRDVSERIAAAEKIAASEQRFRSTLHNMIEGVQIIGFDWKYIFANKAFAKQAGCSPEALIGYPVLEKFPCLEHNEIYQVCQRCFNERIPLQLEHEFTFPDRTTGWFELSLQPVPEGVFILSVDITEKKRTEDALQVERAKLDKIAATAPGLIYSFRMDNKGSFSFPYASNAVEDIFGLRFQEIQHDAEKVFAKLNPAEMEKVFASIEHSAKALCPWSYEYEYDHPVKGKIWLYANSIPAREADGSIIWHGVISDITGVKNAERELKISRERFQYATKASSDIVWELNFDTREYVVYEGKEKLFGNDQTINWDTGVQGNYIVEKDRERVRKSFAKARADINQELWNDEYEVYAVDGNILKMVNHAIFIRDANGLVTRVIGAMKDVTEERKLEVELHEQQRREQLMITSAALEAQEKERNALGMELHDNVNQLLIGANMLLKMVDNHHPKSEELVKTSMKYVKDAIAENRKLAHELVSPDLGADSLPALIEHLTNTTLVNAGIQASVDCSQYQESRINDQIKLAVYRVVQEQCSNIIKYAEAKNAHVVLSTAKNKFTMRISDDGKGMHRDIKTKSAGIGLRNIAARMSVLCGRVDIDTSPGNGFTLIVKVPLVKLQTTSLTHP